MNSVVITGKIFSSIDYELNGEMVSCKFSVQNQTYTATRGKMDTTVVPCRATGALADYIYHEMYEGCNVIVTGVVRQSYYRLKNNVTRNIIYISCRTVSRLDQEDYT